MERNILITIEYDGSGFCGWQRQKDQRTVQGELESVLSKVCGKEVVINGTSRTDRGVHALGQRASFKGDFGIPTDRIMIAANNLLAGGQNSLRGVGDVRIRSIKEVPLDFHARFDAKGKTYRYIILNSDNLDIFRRNYCYQVKYPLNLNDMKEAAQYIEGTHDFACFQASGGQERETTVRNISKINIEKKGEDILIDVTGDGFLYNMVRIITGTLVEVGLGKKRPSDLKVIIESKDRRQAGHTAPGAGLYLMEVFYE